MNTTRQALIDAIREAVEGRSLLVEAGTPPDRYPTLRIGRDPSGGWDVSLRGREGHSFGGTENEVFVPVELHADHVDWSRAVKVMPDGAHAIDEDLRQKVAAQAQAAHVNANIGIWTDAVLNALRERGQLSAVP